MQRSLDQQIQANIRASWFYSILLVLVLGALGGFIVGYFDMKSWPLGVVGAIFLGIGLAVYTRFFGAETVLSISGAREATPYEQQLVQNVAEEVSIAAGIPVPRVYILDESSPNAFATGMTPDKGIVCVTSGLLKKLNRDELQGVVAHEIAHIRNLDTRLMTTIALIAGLIPLLADFFLRMNFYGGSRRSSSRDNNAGVAIFLVVGLLFAILAPIFAKLLELAVSRKREFLADATAAKLTRYPEGLASALLKIAHDPDPVDQANRATAHLYIASPTKKDEFVSSLFSTHPPIEDRVRALRGIFGQSNLESLSN